MPRKNSFEILVDEAKQRIETLESLSRAEEAFKKERLSYIKEAYRVDRIQNRLRQPAVFLSYAKKSGAELANDIRKTIRKTVAPAVNRNFELKTGFSRKGEPKVVNHIISEIEQCSIFVGVLTKEYEVKPQRGEGGGFIPGAWVLLEAGMAIELDLSIIYFVEKEVRRDFWLDQLGDWRHVEFQRRGLQSALETLKNAVVERYQALW